ncbi:histidine phosphatase family protein [Mycobacterium sp. ACS4331]|uniref:histidine phosphatase family protein n=1 Tax=Mycobacterium sp. ACS4331 TaxID=1834121 RepID=UPI0007FFB6A7|nr:histidine phosphatase family protein [Mycobacterium sp. ACS4331]OBF16466.1 histidine phosphatase [Mycobacterium sp. ACS4331]
MSEVVRLTLVSHAMTDAMSAGRFPADEPLSELGRRQLADVGVDPQTALCGPEVRTRQTAAALGLTATPEPGLADLDVGVWAGSGLDEIDPGELAAWLTDPSAAPHGGESIVTLVRRVSDWMDSLALTPSKLMAVTHPAVIRAAILIALDAPPKSFWRIDIAPGSQTVLHRRGPGWTLRL